MKKILNLIYIVCVLILALGLCYLGFGNINIDRSYFVMIAALPVMTLLVAIAVERKVWRKESQTLHLQTQTKSDFISVLSHDLKTPLARIQAMSELISLNPAGLTYEQKLALSQIERSQKELSHFIDSMVQMSRLEEGVLSLNLKSADINQVVSDVVKDFKFLAEEKNIEIFTELEPLFNFKFDPSLLKQVVQNIVENSLKYSGSYSRLLIASEDKKDSIVVQITDEGMGIPSQDIKFIFERYYRSPEAKSRLRSSGLGLYLAKAFVDLHYGELKVKSKEGIGSTFTISLPKDLEKTNGL